MRLSVAVLVAVVNAAVPGDTRAACDEYSAYQNDPVGFLRYWNWEAQGYIYGANLASWEQGAC